MDFYKWQSAIGQKSNKNLSNLSKKRAAEMLRTIFPKDERSVSEGDANVDVVQTFLSDQDR